MNEDPVPEEPQPEQPESEQQDLFVTDILILNYGNDHLEEVHYRINISALLRQHKKDVAIRERLDKMDRIFYTSLAVITILGLGAIASGLIVDTMRKSTNDSDKNGKAKVEKFLKPVKEGVNEE